MRAVVCEGPGDVRLVERAVPSPGPSEVLVRVSVALTCGTDLKLARRGHPRIPFPVTLGHELCGIVEAAGRDTAFREGDRVTSAVSGPCLTCPSCRGGQENLCARAFDHPLFGAFAEYLLVPAAIVASGLRRVPEGLAGEAAALLDPLASVVRGLARARAFLGRPDRLTLLGSGPIAALFTALAVREGMAVDVVGRNPGRLAILAGLGARVFPRGEAVGGSPLVVDTTGNLDVIAEGMTRVNRGGALLLFAGLPKGAPITVDGERVHYDEVTLLGSFHYTPREADEALSHLAAGHVPVDALVTAHAPLEDFALAFERAGRGEGMKTALHP
ncbi:MAG: alcohol dehydrogenase catalytic domain-containing protein [Acidobacteria bacterium]|nr:alcohol dehydrogenase catalytic domain-containing protein [Acidobacteriota bacterium]